MLMVTSGGMSYSERTRISMRRSRAGAGPAGGVFCALQPTVRPRTSSPAKKRNRNKVFSSQKRISQRGVWPPAGALDFPAVIEGCRPQTIEGRTMGRKATEFVLPAFSILLDGSFLGWLIL